MQKSVHPNFIKASNFIFLTLLFGLGNLIFGEPQHDMDRTTFTIVGIIMLGIILGCALGVRRGIVWIKYVYVVLAVLGLMGIPLILQNLESNVGLGLINLAQCLVQLWAAVLLLMTGKGK